MNFKLTAAVTLAAGTLGWAANPDIAKFSSLLAFKNRLGDLLMN